MKKINLYEFKIKNMGGREILSLKQTRKIDTVVEK